MKIMNSFTVRYAETDQMGIVHHSNYPIWFETGRTEYFRKIGISYSEIERRGYLLPLTEVSVTFKSPARYEDDILVVTRITSMTCVRLEFEYQIINNMTNQLYAKGKTSHAWTDKQFKPLDFLKAQPEIFDILKKSMSVTV